MSSVVGKLNISSNSGTLNIGDVAKIDPETKQKTFSGQGYQSVTKNIEIINKVQKIIEKSS